MNESGPKLYTELAQWWPLLSSPQHYEKEAAFYRDLIQSHAEPPLTSVLELGAGGGNNAYHLKRDFQMTLVDLSSHMARVSRKINPDCEHVEGDMRSVRLGRVFDAVFIHDAILYMTTEVELRNAMETAFVHCRPGGVAVLVPDFVKETFEAGTVEGGHDDGDRGMRYLEWTWDPNPSDTTYVADFAYILRNNGSVRVEHDRHIFGIFPRDRWLQLMRDVGFAPRMVATGHNTDDDWPRQAFVGVKPPVR
jgi:SAM-dependent methyltransferase